MKRMMLTLVATLFIAVTAAQTSAIISGNTSFSIGSVAGTVRGTFEAPTGTFVFDPADLSKARIDISIATVSIFTDHKRRDADAKSEKYLGVEQFPTIHFTSTAVTAKGNAYVTTGNLRIKDTTKVVTLPFNAKRNEDGTYSLSSTFEINRLDYGIGGKTFMLRNLATVSMDAVAK